MILYSHVILIERGGYAKCVVYVFPYDDIGVRSYKVFDPYDLHICEMLIRLDLLLLSL
jgi:hypothetical protein